MVATPWGDSETLREEMLTPGPSNLPESVVENQRQRLFGAMVASVAERGYADTRIADLVETSGVSLRSFYDLFPDKQACFVGAVDALVRWTIGPVLESSGPDDWEVDSRRRLGFAAALAAAQPAAAKLCLVEAYAAGPAAVELVDEAASRMEAIVSERLAGSSRWASLPPEIGTFAIGTILATFRSRLVADRGDRIPEIADPLASLLLHYEPPVRPLRSAARPPESRPEELEASDHAERALRAFEALLAKQTFAETTMEQVAKRAGMSVRTLYANFAGRQDLILAAIDSAAAQVVAVGLPAYRRESSAPEGIRVALTAVLGLLASRPNLAHLLLNATLEGGEPALRRRAEALQPLEGLLAGVAPRDPQLSPGLFSEAALGGLLWLARRRANETGAGSLPGLAPIATYIALAPTLGAEQATSAAEGKSYRRPPAEDRKRFRPAIQPGHERVAVALSQGPLDVDSIARKTGLSRQEVEVQVGKLIEAGIIEAIAGQRYRSRWPVVSTEDWERLDQAERENVSAAIGRAIKEEVEDSAAAGVFDARPERYLVRFPAWVDEQGWREISSSLDSALEECFAIQRRAQERLDRGEGHGEAFPARILLVSYEALPGADPGA